MTSKPISLRQKEWLHRKAKVKAAIDSATDSIVAAIHAQMHTVLDDIKAIREKKLYIEGGYQTFDEFCRKVVGICARRVHQLFDAENVRAALGATGNLFPLLNDTATAELKGIEPEKAAEIVQVARASHPKKKATAAGIKKAKARVIEPARSAESEPPERTPCPHCQGTGFLPPAAKEKPTPGTTMGEEIRQAHQRIKP